MKRKSPRRWKFADAQKALRGMAARLHRDDRGAISVLVLLTIWCLVALAAMIWNTAEHATRKQQLQTAADSAAHAAATAMARLLNATTAQNMVICQDTSTETIARAVEPTRAAIRARFDAELARLQRDQVDTDAMRAQITRRLEAVDRAYEPLRVQIGRLSSDIGVGITDPRELLLHRNEKRRAASVIRWVHDTYVEGGPAVLGGGPTRPPPPTYDGQTGLRNIVAHFRAKQSDATIRAIIDAFIRGEETVILAQFEMRTRPALEALLPGILPAHRASVFEQQRAMRDRFSQDVEEQRRRLAEYYRADLTYASIGNPAAEGPAAIEPPVRLAEEVPLWFHHDGLRPKYPLQTILRFGSLYIDFNIDPINPHTSTEMIWHPGRDVRIVMRLPGLGLEVMDIGLASTPADPVFGEGWGHAWATPLERYFHERVDADQRILNTEHMVKLDEARSVTLADRIRNLLGLPGEGVIPELPFTIPDDEPDPAAGPEAPPAYINLPVPHNLRSPAAALTPYRDMIDLYNRLARTYCSEVRALWRAINDYRDAYGYYIEAFASETWHRQVDNQRHIMARAMGAGKQFAVMRTYELRPIPDWALAGMYASVFEAVREELIRMNQRQVIERVTRLLVERDPLNWGAPFLDEDVRRRYLWAHYHPYAVRAAREGLAAAVVPVAVEIATEWVSRPWPYEITPSPLPAPPARGISRPDRLKHFTAVAAARQTAGNQPRVLMNWIFKPDGTKLVTTAQADAFSWMEFNDAYGGLERYDEVVRAPWSSRSPDMYQHFVGAPRSWRDATVGGWNWRSRLSFGDGIFDAAQTNADLRQYLQDAGLTTSDRESFNVLQLH